MKRFLSLFSGLLLAAFVGFAQEQWELSSVTPYGTGGINRGGERIDNSYRNGNFNSEVKSNDRDGYVYFRRGHFNVPPKTFRPGQSFTVNMSVTLKRHSGRGTPDGTAGATIAKGKAGRNTHVPLELDFSSKDKIRNASTTLVIPSHANAGQYFSIVYECLDIKVVYLYKWVGEEPVVADDTPVEEAPIADSIAVAPVGEEITLEDGTILPPEEEWVADSLAVAEELFGEPEEEVVESVAEAEQKAPAVKKSERRYKSPSKMDGIDKFLVFVEDKLGLQLDRKDLLLYGIIGGVVLLLLIVLLILLFRKSPAKKAEKEAARQAAAEAKAAAKAEREAKAAEARAEREQRAAELKAAQEAKRAELAKKRAEMMAARQAGAPAPQVNEAKAAAAAKAAEAKAAREAKLAEAKAAKEAQAAEAAEAKAAKEAQAAEAKAAKEAKLAEARAAQEAKRAEIEKRRAEAKAAQEARIAEAKARQEAARAAAAAKTAAATGAAAAKAQAAPKPEAPAQEEPKKAAPRFCENCGSPLAPDAAFCENCGHKVS